MQLKPASKLQDRESHFFEAFRRPAAPGLLVLLLAPKPCKPCKPVEGSLVESYGMRGVARYGPVIRCGCSCTHARVPGYPGTRVPGYPGYA
eukprot:2754059-Rhodomonas_salina.1